MDVFKDYTVEALAKEFCVHADKVEDRWKKEPSNYDEFNLARALSVMCTEIEKLKHRL